jgi:chromosome segregation ATPase
MAPSTSALADIARALEDNIAQVSAREAAWSQRASAPALAAKHRQWLAAQTAPRQALSAPVEAAAARAEVNDAELQVCEAELRELAAHLEDLRQKLAAWAARAIG